MIPAEEEDEDKLDLELEVDYEDTKTRTIHKKKLKYIVDCLENGDRIHYYPGPFNYLVQRKFLIYINDKRGTEFKSTTFGSHHHKGQTSVSFS